MDRYADGNPYVRGGFYTMSPAPRNNPDGRLDGEWVIRHHLANVLPKGRVIVRFTSDGRDMCEAWLRARHYRRIEA